MKEKIYILGAGESGTGAALLAAKKGFDVFVSDAGYIRDQYKKELDQNGIDWEEGGHSEQVIMTADRIIKSPGIPDNIPLIEKICEKGIPVISEIEFAAFFTSAIKVCVTGSNGKTTTTKLIGHMAENAGLNVGVAGNVGKSFARLVAREHHDVYVIELSSFQLDNLYDFKADIAILLNITPDHLDRYQYKLDNYVDSKFRIIQNMSEKDHFIFSADDSVVIKEMSERKILPRKYSFTLKEDPSHIAYLKGNELIINDQQNVLTMSIFDLAIKGKHNVSNSMAAGIAGRILDIRNESIRESLSDFQGIEHRLESFLKVRNILFINDSKATNVNSTWYALESVQRPVVWIAGGVDKGNDYGSLKALVREKVKAIVCLGLDNQKLHDEFENIVPEMVDADNMNEAVRKAYFLAKKEEVVLLSPACASFDLFDNYEDRGRQFKKAVRNL